MRTTTEPDANVERAASASACCAGVPRGHTAAVRSPSDEETSTSADTTSSRLDIFRSSHFWAAGVSICLSMKQNWYGYGLNCACDEIHRRARSAVAVCHRSDRIFEWWTPLPGRSGADPVRRRPPPAWGRSARAQGVRMSCRHNRMPRSMGAVTPSAQRDPKRGSCADMRSAGPVGNPSSTSSLGASG